MAKKKTNRMKVILTAYGGFLKSKVFYEDNPTLTIQIPCETGGALSFLCSGHKVNDAWEYILQTEEPNRTRRFDSATIRKLKKGGWSIKAGGLKIQTNSIKLFLNTTKKCKMIGNSVTQHYISKRGSGTAEGLTKKEHKATHERNRTKL